MCFNTTKKSKPKIASEDILCWKVLKRKRTKKGYGAKFNNTGIHPNLYYMPGEKQEPIKIRKEKSCFGEDEYEINKGYHSYTSEAKARIGKEREEKVFLFIIPKGTKYYHNIWDCEYVSETIIMCK